MKNKEKKKVLISEDECISAELFRSFIEDLGHTVVSVTHRVEDTLQQIWCDSCDGLSFGALIDEELKCVRCGSIVQVVVV